MNLYFKSNENLVLLKIYGAIKRIKISTDILDTHLIRNISSAFRRTW